VLDLTDVTGAFVHGCAPGPHTEVFARVAGRDTRSVVFEGNALAFAFSAGLPALPVQIAPDVPRGVVTGHPSGVPHAPDPR
jgi:hypothetical protein